MADTKINWGIIGVGGIALKRMIPAMCQMQDEIRLLAVQDINSQVLKCAVEEYGIPNSYTKVEELLSNREIDAVYVATPLPAHFEICLKAANASKHILCEKPLCQTVKQCEELIEAADKNNIKLGVGFLMRFHAIHQKVKQLIDDGALGQVVLARAQLSHYKVEYNPDGTASWRSEKAKAAGGSLMDMGIHCIDLLRYWLGDVKEIMAMTDTLTNDYDVEDTACVIMKHSNDAQSIVDACFNIKGAKNVFEVYGTNGSVFGEGTIDQLPGGKMVMNIAGEVSEYQYEPVNTYCQEIRMMNRSILQNTQPLISGNEGLRNLDLVLKAYESSGSGKKIEV